MDHCELAAGSSGLLNVSLLHLSTRPPVWQPRFKAKSVAAPDVPELGIALLPRFLMEPEFASRALMEARAQWKAPRVIAWCDLVWPARRSSYPPLQTLREWLHPEVLGP